ncbi:MAG: 4-hydroxy-3-methylbut-2-enyl diphosphate reductase, partial [Actinomycetota bacterium]
LYGPPVYVLHEIVHNRHVLEDFRGRGVCFVEDLAEIPEGSVTIFSAHGVAGEIEARGRTRNLRVIDATCPLVTKVHLEARRFARDGYTILLIGHEGHEEVTGTSGEAPERIILVGSPEEARAVSVPDPNRVAYLCQTTLSVDETNEVIEVLKERFPNIEGPPRDDICYATQNRQEAVKDLARRSDVVLVIGSDNSSNSKRLVEVATAMGTPAFLIDDESEIDPAWVDGRDTVGVTSGASAPEWLVERVVDALKARGATRVEQLHTVDEQMRFSLPSGVREPAGQAVP